MTSKSKTRDSKRAKEDLEAIERASLAARKRGTYPIWAAVLMSAWVGLMTTLTLMDYDKTLYVLLAGAAALIYFRRQKGAWILDFKGPGNVGFGAAAILGLAIIIGGGILIAKTYAFEGAPVPIGIVVGIYIFALMAMAHGKTWAGKDGA